MSLHSFAYYIQYAKGDLSLHFFGHVLMLIVLVPLFVVGAIYFGAIGTGLAWALVNGLYALCWMPIVHARLLKGMHWQWLWHDVLPIVVPTALCGWLLSVIVPLPVSRWSALATALLAGAVLFVFAALGSRAARGLGRELFERWLARPLGAAFLGTKARQQRSR